MINKDLYICTHCKSIVKLDCRLGYAPIKDTGQENFGECAACAYNYNARKEYGFKPLVKIDKKTEDWIKLLYEI